MERDRLISLVTAAKQGDGEGMNTLFSEFYQDVYYFALKTVKDDQIAADVTQESFVEIIRTLQNLQEPAAFVTWMKQITYHQCTRYFKKKKDVLVEEDEDGNTVFDEMVEEKAEFIPDAALDQDEFKKTVLAILDTLSEEQRAAVMLFYFEEMSIREIAEVQGVNENTVKSRLNYARKALKKSVEDYEKKTGVRLHCLGVLPIMLFVFKDAFTGAVPAATAQAIAGGVTAATGVAVSTAAATVATAASATAAATAGAATATAAVTAGIGAKLAAIPLVGKVIACVVAGSLVVGGGTAVILNQIEDDSSEVQDYAEEGIIPEGMVYTTHDGTVLQAGDPFPKACTRGDKVVYGDYHYGYECVYVRNLEQTETDYEWITVEYFEQKGGKIPADSGVVKEDITGCWLPIVSDQGKTKYGPIENKINGKPIGALWMTFFGCKSMIEAPAIPNGVKSISVAFYDCVSLQRAPLIPASVQRIASAFRGCRALSGDVVLEGKLDTSSFWYYYGVFSACEKAINLTGKMAEEELFLIAGKTYLAEGGVLTVNGKPALTENDTVIEEEEALRFYTLDRLSDSSLSLVEAARRSLKNAEDVAGFGGGEIGEPVNAIFAADHSAASVADMDIFGYGVTVDELLGLNWGHGDLQAWLIPEENKTIWESEHTRTEVVSAGFYFSVPLQNKADILTLVQRDLRIFESKLEGKGAPYVRIGGFEHPSDREVGWVTAHEIDSFANLAPNSEIGIYTTEPLQVDGRNFRVHFTLSAKEEEGIYYYGVSLSYSYETDPELF